MDASTATFLPNVGDEWAAHDCKIVRGDDGKLKVTEVKLARGAKKTASTVMITSSDVACSITVPVYATNNGRMYAPLGDYLHYPLISNTLDEMFAKIGDNKTRFDENVAKVILRGSFRILGDTVSIALVDEDGGKDEACENDVAGAVGMVRSEVEEIVGGGGMDEFFGDDKDAFLERLGGMDARKISEDADVLSVLLWSLNDNLRDHVASEDFKNAVDPEDREAFFAGDFVRRGAVALFGAGRTSEEAVWKAVLFAKSVFKDTGVRVVDAAMFYDDDALAVEASAHHELRLVTLCLLRAMIRHGHMWQATERAYFWYLTFHVLDTLTVDDNLSVIDRDHIEKSKGLLQEGYSTVFAEYPDMKKFADAVLGFEGRSEEIEAAIRTAVDEGKRGPVCSIIAPIVPKAEDVPMTDA